MTGPVVLLVGHGSRNPAAAATVDAIAAEVASVAGLAAAAAHLEFSPPTPADALVRLADAGHHRVVVVPLLFTPGHHVTVDLPRHVSAARALRPSLRVRAAGPLLQVPGAAHHLLDALDARLAGPINETSLPPDALVLAAAGSSHRGSLAAVDDLARQWAGRHGLPVRAGYASGSGEAVGAVVEDLARTGRRVAVGSLFIAQGRLPAQVRRQARDAGATAVADVIGTHPALIRAIVAAASQRSAGTRHQAVEQVGLGAGEPDREEEDSFVGGVAAPDVSGEDRTQ